MRFLLFLVSFGYSLIFSVFYSLSNGKDIFGEPLEEVIQISPISGNFLVEVGLFIFLGVFFVLFFSPLGENKKSLNKRILFINLIHLLLIVPIFFNFFYKDIFIILVIIIFFISNFLFIFLSNIPNLKKYKLKLRYIGLGLNYLVAIVSLLYLYFFEISYYLILVTIFNIVFNYDLYKNYGNYISLAVSFILLLIISIIIFLKIKELYVILFLFTN